MYSARVLVPVAGRRSPPIGARVELVLVPVAGGERFSPPPPSWCPSQRRCHWSSCPRSLPSCKQALCAGALEHFRWLRGVWNWRTERERGGGCGGAGQKCKQVEKEKTGLVCGVEGAGRGGGPEDKGQDTFLFSSRNYVPGTPHRAILIELRALEFESSIRALYLAI